MSETPNPETVERIKQVLLEAVKRHAGTASFVDLEHAMSAADVEYQGDCMLSSLGFLMLWSQWNHEAFQALSELQREDLVHYIGTSELVYMYDGKAPRLPVAEELAKKGYSPNLSWYPVVIKPGPLPEHLKLETP